MTLDGSPHQAEARALARAQLLDNVAASTKPLFTRGLPLDPSRQRPESVIKDRHIRVDHLELSLVPATNRDSSPFKK
jgi:hypothetical protein